MALSSRKRIAQSDPLIRGYLLSAALGVSDATIKRYIQEEKLPRPDAHGEGAAYLWRLSAIRDWEPALAERIERLLATLAAKP